MEEKKKYTVEEFIELFVKWKIAAESLILTGASYKLAQTIATQNGVSENDEVEVTIGDEKKVMIPAEMYKKSIAVAEEHDKIYAELKTAMISHSCCDSATDANFDNILAKFKTCFDENAFVTNFETSLAEFKAHFLFDASTPVTKEGN